MLPATCLLGFCLVVRAAAEPACDVVVYGGTAGGVAAAVQVARMGKRVVLIEPGDRLGGLSSGGLGATDIGNKRGIGGIAREFYHRLYLHYAKPQAWRYGSRTEYLAVSAGRKSWDADQAWWIFEPSAALAVFQDLVREAGVEVVYGERLDLKNGVRKEGLRICEIRMESGRRFAGRVFIDASYEGDLLAKAGVSYAVGREPNARWGETLNGVQPNRQMERYYFFHQFKHNVDPFLRPGDPASGLLPGVEAQGPGAEGAGDHRIQAYCFRTCLTDQPGNLVPLAKPNDYDPRRYELLLRYYEAGFDKLPVDPLARIGPKGLSPGARLPNQKTDNNNIYALSVDNTGMNYAYPDGDYATRERIVRDHAAYQQGLYWTLANNPRVPAGLRQEMRRWGLAKDEFTESGNWPRQLYVREARRMIGQYVMTELNCWRKRVADDSIGLAAYGMDSHNVQRYVDRQGHVRNEGNVQSEGNVELQPYPISCRAIVPLAGQCTNLLSPVCVSASHVAFGSIRMEPVFMILGQSAGAAAVQAIDQRCDVQTIDQNRLRARLLAQKQVLEWPPPK